MSHLKGYGLHHDFNHHDELYYSTAIPHVNIESSSTAGSSRRQSQVSPSLSCSNFSTGLHLGVPANALGAEFPLSLSFGDLTRVRSFSTSGKRIVNKGDSILSTSNISLYNRNKR